MKRLLLIILVFICFVFKTKNECNSGIYMNIEKYTYDDYLEEQEVKYLNMKLDSILQIISFVESSFNIFAYNEIEEAAGILQIRPIMVAEVNQIVGYKKFTLDDRWCKEKSYQMFKIYQDFVNPQYDEILAARFWNGGRSGDKKTATNIYVDKFLQKKDELFNDDYILVIN